MKITTYILLVSLLLALFACGGQADTIEGLNTTPSITAIQNTSTTQTAAGDEVTAELRLLLGTFQLEGTNLAVTADQAKVLVPLWQQLEPLSQTSGFGAGFGNQGQDNATPTPSTKGTDTKSQVNELVEQIQAAMTPEQMALIEQTQTTWATAITIMQGQGVRFGRFPQGGSNQTGNGQQSGGGAPAEGTEQAPQSTRVVNSGGGSENDNSGTPSASGQPSGSFNLASQMTFIPPGMIDALVQLLMEKNGVQPTITPAQILTESTPRPAAALSNSGAYTQSGGAQTLMSQAFTTTGTDEDAIHVTNGGTLTLTDSTIITSGDTSSQEDSSSTGLNAAVLADQSSTLNLSNARINTSGAGASGVFAAGNGSAASLANVAVRTTGDGADGIEATNGGSLALDFTDVSTAGANASAIAASSDGTVRVRGGTIAASGSEVAAIDGTGSITMINATISSSVEDRWGILVYQDESRAADAIGSFTMNGGSLASTATNGALFYVTNTTGVINLDSVDLNTASGTLVRAAGGDWGDSGANGGTVLLTASEQTLTGDLLADSLSAITLTLRDSSTLTGAINPTDTARSANLTLDVSSTWTVTANSYLSVFSDEDGITSSTITNIIGNGHTVYYDASLAANNALGGKTYSLSGGGTLEPIK